MGACPHNHTCSSSSSSLFWTPTKENIYCIQGVPTFRILLPSPGVNPKVVGWTSHSQYVVVPVLTLGSMWPQGQTFYLMLQGREVVIGCSVLIVNVMVSVGFHRISSERILNSQNCVMGPTISPTGLQFQMHAL